MSISKVLAALMLVPLLAVAQTTQPVYVRPSKGAALKIFTNATGGPLTGPVLDMSAFDSVLMLPECTGGCGGSVLSYRLEGATVAAGPFTTTLINDNNLFSGLAATSASALPPFIRMVMTVNPGSAITMTIVPIPFAIRQAVRGSVVDNANSTAQVEPVLIGGVIRASGNVVVRTAAIKRVGGLGAQDMDQLVVATLGASTSTSSAAVTVNNAATEVVAYGDPYSYCSTTVVNTDTTAAYCSQTGGVTAANGIPLNPATGAGLAGGSFTFPSYGGTVYCITAAGSTTVRVQRTACP